MGHKLQNSEGASAFSLAELIKAAEAQKRGEGAPPVELWEPEYCGEMDLVIRRDGSWWHEGSPIGRKKLVELFSTILRKDADGETYLVTPVEKIQIKVELAHFIAVRVDRTETEVGPALIFTTNVGDKIMASAERPLTVITDKQTQEPTPLLSVRGRLTALLSRPVFYELVNIAESRDTVDGEQLGVVSAGEFFPLGPAGII